MFDVESVPTGALAEIHNQHVDMIRNPRDCDYQGLYRSVYKIKCELIKRKIVSEYVLEYRGRL